MIRLLGGLLLGLGILVAGASGLCSVLVIASEMPLSALDLREGLPIVLAFGGIPLLIGLAMIWGGRRLLRSDSVPPSASPAPPTEGSEP